MLPGLLLGLAPFIFGLDTEDPYELSLLLWPALYAGHSLEMV